MGFDFGFMMGLPITLLCEMGISCLDKVTFDKEMIEVMKFWSNNGY